MLANPYEPVTSTGDTLGARDWERDQCPFCLQRQSIWNAINSIRTYRCLQCKQPLVVTLSRAWSRVVTATIFVLLGAFIVCEYILDLMPTSYYVVYISPIFIASGFGLRYWFGYFHPIGRPWVRTRRELEAAHPHQRSG